MTVPDDLLDRSRAWAAGDPDPDTRAQLERAIDERDLVALRAAMDPPLAFGTAGLRGPVGPGAARMNRATVIRTTRGLAEHVLAEHPVEPAGAAAPLVVVGFDARPDSPRFARDVVAVLAGAGIEAAWFDQPVPTPLVAYAARTLGAAAAVVITASHNPPADNGYKVYGSTASQIVAPVDVRIATRIEGVGPADRIPRQAPEDSPLVRRLGDEIATAYLDDLDAVRPVPGPGAGPVIVYTPLHGVAGGLVRRALERAGHTRVHDVASQAEPDGTFPTVAFPNPEEPGALDEALSTAVAHDADLVLANDPDGDRLAVAVRRGDGHRVLTGNELGVLLGDHLLSHSSAPDPLVVSSIVSSPMLRDVAAAHGAHHETTLTGFKWICRAGIDRERERGWHLVLGYEEALGYAVGGLVRDKDGISAAVVVADLARTLQGEGSSITRRLDELARRHGLWVSVQRSVTLDPAAGEAVVARALDVLVAEPPRQLAGLTVRHVLDHRVPSAGSPPWLPPSDLVELGVEGGGRALVRPSGTEPKCKVYVDLRAPAQADLDVQRSRLREEAFAVADAVLDHAGLT
jgi:phosphomannomutase